MSGTMHSAVHTHHVRHAQLAQPSGGNPLLLSTLVVQEFNLEKLQLLEQEKAKIRKEYERREGQVEVKKKM
mgnify:CR=1 FL=1